MVVIGLGILSQQIKVITLVNTPGDVYAISADLSCFQTTLHIQLDLTSNVYKGRPTQSLFLTQLSMLNNCRLFQQFKVRHIYYQICVEYPQSSLGKRYSTNVAFTSLKLLLKAVITFH